MLTLGRGGPVVWLSEADAKIWVSPITTGLKYSTATVLCCPCGCQPACSGRDDHDVPREERIVNLPGSEITQQRGGIHTRSPVSRRNRRI